MCPRPPACVSLSHTPFWRLVQSVLSLKCWLPRSGQCASTKRAVWWGPWGPVLLTPHPRAPYGLFLSAAFLIHSILAVASCVTETARNFCLAFNSGEIPVTVFLLLRGKKKNQSSALENSAFPLGTTVHRKRLSSRSSSFPQPPSWSPFCASKARTSATHRPLTQLSLSP